MLFKNHESRAGLIPCDHLLRGSADTLQDIADLAAK